MLIIPRADPSQLQTAGALIGAFATGLPMLFVGRVIVGAGNSFSNIGCVCLLNEITHPRLRR